MAKKSSKKQKPAKAPKPRKRTSASARSQPLPGMEQVRSQPLDNACETIAEIRAQYSVLSKDEQVAMDAALKVMHARDLTSYHHAGVELARVVGEEKIRVRWKPERTTSAEDLGEASGKDESGEGLGETEPVDGDGAGLD